jgi:hypothetical protein
MKLNKPITIPMLYSNIELNNYLEPLDVFLTSYADANLCIILVNKCEEPYDKITINIPDAPFNANNDYIFINDPTDQKGYNELMVKLELAIDEFANDGEGPMFMPSGYNDYTYLRPSEKLLDFLIKNEYINEKRYAELNRKID